LGLGPKPALTLAGRAYK